MRRDAFSWSNIANSFRSKTGWDGALNLLQEARTLEFWSIAAYGIRWKFDGIGWNMMDDGQPYEKTFLVGLNPISAN